MKLPTKFTRRHHRGWRRAYFAGGRVMPGLSYYRMPYGRPFYVFAATGQRLFRFGWDWRWRFTRPHVIYTGDEPVRQQLAAAIEVAGHVVSIRFAR